MNGIKNAVLAAFGFVGSAIIGLFGGWDRSMQTLIIFIGIDFILGILLAAVWKKSTKTATGAVESRACLKGLFRKGGILLVVLIGVRLDAAIGSEALCRTAVILYFLGNEGISIIENLGTMGVPLPTWLKERFEALKNNTPKNKE